MRRSAYLTWHRHLALLFAPLLLLQVLTGAVLLLKEPLGRVIGPQASDGPPLHPSALIAAAAETGWRVMRLYPASYPGAPAMAHLAAADGTARYAAIEPTSGVLLRQGGIADFPIEGALEWHYRLIGGTAGLAVVALNGLALLVLAGTGLAFWLPPKGRWRKSLAINSRMPARIRLRHWHRSTGVVVSLMVLFSAFTGILLAVPDLIPATAAPTKAYAATPAQIERAVAAAQRTYPDAAIRDIRFPPVDRIDVNLLAPEARPLAVHAVQVRLSDAKVLKIVPAAQSPALWMTVMPLHTGQSAGVAGMIVLVLEALALAALSITGPMMWWQQRKLRK